MRNRRHIFTIVIAIVCSVFLSIPALSYAEEPEYLKDGDLVSIRTMGEQYVSIIPATNNHSQPSTKGPEDLRWLSARDNRDAAHLFKVTSLDNPGSHEAIQPGHAISFTLVNSGFGELNVDMGSVHSHDPLFGSTGPAVMHFTIIPTDSSASKILYDTSVGIRGTQVDWWWSLRTIHVRGEWFTKGRQYDNVVVGTGSDQMVNFMLVKRTMPEK